MSDWPTINLLEQRYNITPWHPWAIGYAVNSQNAVSATWPSANLAIYVPVRIPVPITGQLFHWINGAIVSGNVDVGLYTEDGVKITSTGATAQAVISTTQSVDVTDFALSPNVYYLAIAMDNTTGALARQQPAAAVAAAMGLYGCAQEAVFPLPATATFASLAFSYIPLFGFATRTFI